MRGQPLPEQRSTLPVASVLLRTVLTPLNVQFLFGDILSIFVAQYTASVLLTLLLCAYLLLKKAFCATFYNKNSSGDEIANVNFCTTTTYM